jgi:hypothetical protein
LYVREKSIPPPVDATLNLFMLCEAMQWNHLPVAGGLYDQHPEMLDRFTYIFQEQGKARERKEARDRNKSGSRVAGRGH